MPTSRVDMNFIIMSAAGLLFVAVLATTQMLSARHSSPISARSTGALLSLTPFGNLAAEAPPDQHGLGTIPNRSAIILVIPVAPTNDVVTDFTLRSGNFLNVDKNRITGRFSFHQQQLMMSSDGLASLERAPFKTQHERLTTQ